MLPRWLFKWLTGTRLPVTSGEISSSYLKGPVTIHRDLYGIPYIEAEHPEDAWFALGFCQGQDRAFQLEILLRLVRGRLSELMGKRTLPLDRLSRRIGFHRTSVTQWEALDTSTKQILSAFSRGVNEGRTTGLPKKPHEMLLLRGSFLPFTPIDILGLLKIMSFTLMANWDSELVRLNILLKDGLEALQALDPTYPEWLPVTYPVGKEAGKAIDALAEDLKVFLKVATPGGGSNNWAIAPERTADGYTLVANDPHLAPVMPPHWYLAHVRTPEWTIAGATFAGSPAFPAGCNGIAAWGITAGLVDNTDLFIEIIGEDGTSIKEGEDYIPCQLQEETIHVRGGTPVTERILITPRGPIISPVLEGVDIALSLQATWLSPRPLKGLLHMYEITSFEDLRALFESWPSLSLNMIYGDKEGHIGWQLVGDVPARKQGKGTLPLPGHLPETGWHSEPIPFEKLPHALDPETGYIATANNQPIPGSEKPFLGVDWIDGYRQKAILSQLQAHTNWTLEKVAALQMDTTSIPWQEIKEIILGCTFQQAGARLAQELLAAWDGRVTIDSSAATIFELFTNQMIQKIAQAKAPHTFQEVLGKGFTVLTPHSIMAVRRMGHLIRLLRTQPEGWFDISWQRVIEETLTEVIRLLRDTYGADPTHWKWGNLRTLTFKHPMGEAPALAPFFNIGPFPWGGDANTIPQASSPPLDPTGNPMFVPSMRMVVALSTPPELRFVLPGGQSGNPFSPHYADQLPLWQKGALVTLHWEPEAIVQHARETLQLIPAP